jgi:MarR family transcriptional regulator, lower aerobic nicotinate degradation pathway regulator
MAKYRLLGELIELLEAYEAGQEGREETLIGFSVWLGQHLGYPNPDLSIPAEAAGEKQPWADHESKTILTILIAYLYRYAKHYSKKALEDTPLSTLDEFTFLATLSYRGNLTKTELINLHLLEITSGIEIIKRLEKGDLLESYADPNDRRSKRVKLTSRGREVLEVVMKKMDLVAQVVSGDLSEAEQQRLLPILHRLNDFHAVIHHQDRKSDLEAIKEKYLED